MLSWPCAAANSTDVLKPIGRRETNGPPNFSTSMSHTLHREPFSVRSQFLAMKGCPFEYQRHGSPREISPEDGERLYLNEGLVFAIFGVEACRAVAFLLLILPSPRVQRPEARVGAIGPASTPPRLGHSTSTPLPAGLSRLVTSCERQAKTAPFSAPQPR